MSVTMSATVRRSLSAIAMAGAAALAITTTAAQQSGTTRAPTFTVDPAWPSIPNNWVLGEVTSIATDSRDHIWVLHRPRSIPAEKRAQAAPPVLEFDSTGKLLTSWGGDGAGYDWPEREHGIFVDAKDFVWISGNGGWPRPTSPGTGDDMILKFTMAGKFVMQIGQRGQSKGNTDTENVHQPADTFVDARANELYVADGYGDQRIVVFDTNTGKFKRMWGAFGNAPTPEMKPNPPVPQPQEPGTGRTAAVRPAARGQGVERRNRVRRRPHQQPDPAVHRGREISADRARHQRRCGRGAGPGRLLVLPGQTAAVPVRRRFRAHARRRSSIGRR